MTYLIALDDPQALDADRVGQKFRSLARAARAGFSVPAAVAVSTDAHRYYLLQGHWPAGLVEDIRSAAADLGLADGLSIRSSAVQEDLDAQSFAGQYNTFLRVVNEEALAERIEQVWRSADGQRVQSYLRARRLAGGGAGNPLMGVVIQRMVEAAAAGVAFGCNPLRPARDEIVIEAVTGSAERLVSGEVSPHRAHVHPDRSLQREPLPSSAKTPSVAGESPLPSEQWLRIADLIVALQDAMGEKPLDIEWALDAQEHLWLLQFRRITGLAPSELQVPPGIWTRRIADDLWADRLTPLLAEVMVQHAPRYDLSSICAMLHLPVIRPTLTVIQGYLYVNCENLRRLVARIPIRWRTADIRAFFPQEYPFERIPGPGLAEMLRTLAGGIALLVREPAVIPWICLARTPCNQRRIQRRLRSGQTLPTQGLGQCLDKVRFCLETLARIQEGNQWPYFHANGFTVVLRWLMVDCCGYSHAEFLRRLAAGADNVSLRIERRFRDMAARIHSDPALRSAFRGRDADEVMAQLPASFRKELAALLSEYGCRSRHRTLFVPRWSEAPAEVIGILQALAARAAERQTVGSRTEEAQPQPSEASAAMATTTRWARPLLPAVRHLARRFLDLREQLRFLLDRCLFDIRHSLLDFGRRTGLGEHVLFLTVEELQKIVEGRWSVEAAGRAAELRKKDYLQPVAVSTFYVDGRAVEDFSIDAKVLRGTGTSPGRVSGRARIVTDPANADIHAGDIIVAENTDPGWTPILSTAVGLVAEEGGLLNHCSIVARELQIPAVVGIRGATRRIAEGVRLTIDGGLGLVKVEESQPENRSRP